MALHEVRERDRILAVRHVARSLDPHRLGADPRCERLYACGEALSGSGDVTGDARRRQPGEAELGAEREVCLRHEEPAVLDLLLGPSSFDAMRSTLAVIWAAASGATRATKAWRSRMRRRTGRARGA
jgi:hypothetical protein